MTDQLVVFSEDWHFHCVHGNHFLFHRERRRKSNCEGGEGKLPSCFQGGCLCNAGQLRYEDRIKFVLLWMCIAFSHATSSHVKLQPGPYWKIGAKTNIIRPKTGNNKKKGSRLVHYTNIAKNLKSSRVWAGKSAITDAKKNTRPEGHVNYTQAPAVYMKSLSTYVVSLSQWIITHPQTVNTRFSVLSERVDHWYKNVICYDLVVVNPNKR